MMQDFSNLLNISSPEIIKFKFFGKIGRYALSWKNGQWIITNQRVIFIFRPYYSVNSPILTSNLCRPLILIIPINEIYNVQKGKNKIVIDCKYYGFASGKLKKIGIGFFKRSYEHYNVFERDKLINEIYEFLTPKEKVVSISYCPECGTKIGKDAIYCINCGERL
ncbi:MAG: zinc ribbon domain-containing protein [Candidatus Helarchaeota archaeon]